MGLTLSYETHCVTPDNARGVVSGWQDPELSEEGRRAAAELGARRCDVDAVLASDLRRAAQTARIAFAGTPVPVVLDRRLRECNYGSLNGCPAAELDLARPRHVDEPFAGGGQSFRDVLAATSEVLTEVAAEWDGRHVLLIAHTANKWSLDCLLLGADLADLVRRPFAWQPGWEYRIDTAPDAAWRSRAVAASRVAGPA